MGKFIDLTGQQFGRLRVIEQAGKTEKNQFLWLCECDCGKKNIVLSNNLRRSRTKSCGCLRKEIAIQLWTKHGHSLKNETSKTYRSWTSMIQRCNNPNYRYYHNYGGRGIKICKRWMKFENFLKDMGEQPQKHQIDRINNDEGYSKHNCRWIVNKLNSRNRRNNHVETYDGKTQCLSAWAEDFGISQSVLRCRLNRGWLMREALITPVGKYKRKINE